MKNPFVQKKEKEYAKARASGLSQREAYQKAIAPNMSDEGAQVCGSAYDRRPYVQQMLQRAIEKALDNEKIFNIMKSIIRDAQLCTKTISIGGKLIEVPDNSATIASRDQLFKLLRHPAFSSLSDKELGTDNLPPVVINVVNKAEKNNFDD